MTPCTVLAACLTLVEASDFSDDYRDPSLLDLGQAGSVTGRWSGKDDHDLIAVAGLRGGQTVLFTFRPLVDRVDHSFSAGGELLWQGTPFRHSNWEGRRFGRPALDYRHRDPQSFALTLPDGFNEDGGTRAYFGLYGTHGALAYTMSVVDP